MGEHFASRRRRCSDCDGLCHIRVKLAVSGGIGSSISVIHKTYTFRSIQFRTPLGIQIEFLGNPEAVATIITCGIRIGSRGIGYVTPFVHIISHINRFVIRCGDVIIHRECIRIEQQSEIGVTIPSHKLVIVAKSRGSTNRAAIGHAEIHLWLVSTVCSPSQARIGAGIGVQKHTILLLAPLSIHRKTTLRHCIESTRPATCIIQIPTLKNIGSIRVFRNIIVNPRAVIGSNVCAESDSFHLIPLSMIVFLNRSTIAVNIHTVHKIERVGIAVITNIQRVCIGHSTTIIACVRVVRPHILPLAII